MYFKKIVLLFLLVSAFLLSVAGRSKIVNMLTEDVDAAFEECGEANGGVHERVLKVNTKDYGRHDPSPAIDKPPFKPIPN